MRYLIVILFCGICSIGNTQRPKLYQIVDSSEIVLSNYMAEGLGGSMEVDPEDIDFDLLNKLLFDKINAYRKKSRMSVLTFDSAADKMAFYNCRFGSNSVFTKPIKSRQTFARELKRAHRYIQLPFGIFKTAMSQRFAMDYSGNQPYFYYDEAGGLVYGRRSEVNDESFEIEPVEHYTYDVLADAIFNDFMRSNRKEMQSKYHKVMSVRTMYYDRTVKENRIPKIRASVVYGTPRLSKIK